MSLKCGIIGMPNVGKSTLFNALLKKRVALSANYPFATIEPNTGVVAVPDSRLQTLATIVKDEEKMESLPPLIPAVVEFVDIAGLVKGASTGAGLGNQFLSHIREVDAIIHVLRDFEDPSASSGQVPIIREGSTDPKNDRETVETELALADIQTLEKMVPAQEKLAKISKDPLDTQKLEILNSIRTELEQGHMLGRYTINDERLTSWFRSLPLLTTKLVLYVFNVSEDKYPVILNEVKNLQVASQNLEISSSLSRFGLSLTVEDLRAEGFSYTQDDALVISARLEEELVDLDDTERTEYLKELGIGETGLERLIKKAYHLLELSSFLTAGKKEIRAWTIHKGDKAPQAAGVIHTDFEKKFIRAQVIEFSKYIEAGSLKAAKEKGWVRTEGKDYEIKDGDVVEFLIGS